MSRFRPVELPLEGVCPGTCVRTGGMPRLRASRSVFARKTSAEAAGGVTFSPINGPFRLHPQHLRWYLARSSAESYRGNRFSEDRNRDGIIEEELKHARQNFAGAEESFALAVGHNKKFESAAQAVATANNGSHLKKIGRNGNRELQRNHFTHFQFRA